MRSFLRGVLRNTLRAYPVETHRTVLLIAFLWGTAITGTLLPGVFLISYCCGLLRGIDDIAAPLAGRACLVLCTVPALMYAPALLLRRSVKKAVQRALKEGGQSCLNCGYDLRGLPEKHVCPECGFEYDLESVRQAWRKMVGS